MIRRLGRADWAAYRTLRLAALAADTNAFGATHAEEAARDAAWFADTLERHAVFAAADGEAPVAMLGLAFETLARRRHIGLLWGMYVAPSARGRGLGRALIAAAVTEAARQGLTHLQLGVGTGNAAALALYQAMGFRPYGTEPAALKVDGVELDEHLMWRSVAG